MTSVETQERWDIRKEREQAKHVVCFLLGNCPASGVYMPTFRNTLFHLHRQVWRWNGQSVPKPRHINSRRRVITQKKAYNIQNTAKAWNQESKTIFIGIYCDSFDKTCVHVLAPHTSHNRALWVAKQLWSYPVTRRSVAVCLYHEFTFQCLANTSDVVNIQWRVEK